MIILQEKSDIWYEIRHVYHWGRFFKLKMWRGDFSKHLTNIHPWIKVISMIISHHFPFYYFQNVYVLMFYGERDHMWTQIYAKAKSIFISHCVRLNQISKHVPPCFPYFLPHTYRWYIAGVDFLPQFFPGCLFIPPKWLVIIRHFIYPWLTMMTLTNRHKCENRRCVLRLLR